MILRNLLKYYRAIIIILTPLLLIPLLIINTSESKMAFLLILMAVYWATEVLPLASTSFLPLVFVPVLGIMPANKIGPAYFSDTCVLFLGAVMVAVTFEHHNLHKRVALLVLSKVGSDPRLLLLGFMLPTWFLSMWINNTSATAMMVPIVEAVLIELKSDSQEQNSNNRPPDKTQSEGIPIRDRTAIEIHPVDSVDDDRMRPDIDNDKYREELDKITKGFFLSVAYAASNGGIATITGTGPNFVLHGMLQENFHTDGGLNFGTWILLNLPISAFLFLTTWIWLGLHFIGPRKLFACHRDKERDKRVKQIIKLERKKLGPITFAQGWCIFFFMLLVSLWITKSMDKYGWSKLFELNGKKYVKDSAPAVFIAILLMIWPANNPFSRKQQHAKSAEQVIMPWKVMQNVFPWGILFLIGGGLALAESCKASGLTNLMAKKLEILSELHIVLIVVILTTLTSFLTELTSNTATASVLLPIFLQLAVCLRVHPLLLSLPITLSTSLAFCLPVATPPNTIVFSKDTLRVADMIKAGFVLNILSVIVVNISTFTFVNAYFNFFNLPKWAGQCNKANFTSGYNVTVL